MCNNVETNQGQIVKNMGDVAMILMNQEVFGDTAFDVAHVFPITNLGYTKGK